MKNEKTNSGWIETTVKNFVVTHIELQFQKISNWVGFHKKHPEMSKNRDHCNRCKIKWVDMDNMEGWVNLAFVSSVGNRVVCCKCAAEIVAEKF